MHAVSPETGRSARGRQPQRGTRARAARALRHAATWNGRRFRAVGRDRVPRRATVPSRLQPLSSGGPRRTCASRVVKANTIEPFTFVSGHAPLLVSMPHTGTYIPHDIATR